MALIAPGASARSFTPRLTALVSEKEGTAGASDSFQTVQGQVRSPTTTALVAAGPMLPLSSTARARRVTLPSAVGVQEKLQEARPLASSQVAPLSAETSTAATTPPLSVAVPEMTTGSPTGTVAPAAG